ncbi:MAG: hypothetical protein HQ495_16150 [Alphaproteobacteria bacterium]|nr:hypothetical protein [Alphaproteobacteria bacterium]
MTTVNAGNKWLPPNDKDWIYCAYFRHWRSGKLVYPKTAKYFRFRRKR